MHLLPSVSGAFAHIALIIFFLLLSYSDSLSPNVDWQVQSLVVHMILVTEEMGLLTGHLEIIFLLSFPFLACLMAEHPRAEWCVEFLRQAFWMTSPCPRVLIFSALTIPWTLDPDLPHQLLPLAVSEFLLCSCFSSSPKLNKTTREENEGVCVCGGGCRDGILTLWLLTTPGKVSPCAWVMPQAARHHTQLGGTWCLQESL